MYTGVMYIFWVSSSTRYLRKMCHVCACAEYHSAEIRDFIFSSLSGRGWCRKLDIAS